MISGDVEIRNVETVRRLYDAERRQDIADWLVLWNPDGRHVFPWHGQLAPVVGLDALRAVAEEKFRTRRDVIIHDEVFALAGTNKVFVKLGVQSHFIELGKTRRATIWCLITLDDDARIVELQEVFDLSKAVIVDERQG